MHRLYQMRYVDLPQNYYVSYAAALHSATYFENVMVAHINEIDSLEKPAVMADFLLRFDKVIWCLVTGVYDKRVILSLRTSDTRHSAGEIMRRLVNKIGEGGGHHSKAGGFVPLENGSPTEVERTRQKLKRRLLRALGIRMSRGQRLVPVKE
jgi:nanoRNase/pAp phosphatase (c-di-AMP/oligoRNAs hydrolase)